MPASSPWLPVTSLALQHQLLAMDVGNGALEMYRPLPNLLYTRAWGHCTTPLAKGWVRCTEGIWPTVDKLVVFNDWHLMTNYDSEARSQLTGWVAAHRAQFGTACFSTGARLVSMGVSVANVATSMVGIRLHAPLDRNTFLAQLDTALRG
jgi:hypothetical protein